MDDSENKIELSLEFPGGLPSAEELLKAAELEQAAKYPSSAAMGVGPAPAAPPLPRQPGNPQPQHTPPPPAVQPAPVRVQRRQKNIPQPYPAGNVPAAAPGYVPVPAQPQKPVHRVGTLTMGAALIFTGLCITLGMIDPTFTMLTVLKFSPLVLVMLGVEICISSLAVKNKKLKYDGLSMFYCFLLIAASLGASLVPSLWNSFGPQREYAQQRLEGELYDLAAEAVAKNPDVIDFSTYVWLDGYLGMENSVDWKNLSLDQLDTLGSVNVSVVVKPAADTEAFAVSCLTVWEQLSQTLPFSHSSRNFKVDFTDESDRYWLNLDRYSMTNPTTEVFVQRTQAGDGSGDYAPTGEHAVDFEDSSSQASPEEGTAVQEPQHEGVQDVPEQPDKPEKPTP